MRFQVLSIFPEQFEAFLHQGVIAQGLKKHLLSVEIINPRNFAEGVHQAVDDKPYGGGDGMLMMVEVMEKALLSISQQNRGKVVYLSPQGALWDNHKAKSWADSGEPVTLICGRYAGLDQRFVNHYVDEEVSIGNYILSGGELAAQVIIDSVSRFLPGVLGNKRSAQVESLQDGGLLECPQYTRPREWQGQLVPEVLLSGHHREMSEFQHRVAVVRTAFLRPDLFAASDFKPELPKALQVLRSLPEQELRVLGLSLDILDNLERLKSERESDE